MSNNRQAILKAANHLLRAGGVSGASARAICERAGVAAPTLYHYFGDLNSLYAIIVNEAFEASYKRKKNVALSADPLQDIRNGWHAYVSFALEEPELFIVMNRQVVEGKLPAAAEKSFQMLHNNVQRLSLQRDLSMTVDEAVQVLWSAAHGFNCLNAIKSDHLNINPNLSSIMCELTLKSILK